MAGMSHPVQREGKAAMDAKPDGSQTASNVAGADDVSRDSRKEKGSAGQNLDRQLVLVNKSQDEGAAEEDEEYAF